MTDLSEERTAQIVPAQQDTVAIQNAQNGAKPTRLDEIKAEAGVVDVREAYQAAIDVMIERDYWKRAAEKFEAYARDLEAELAGHTAGKP